MCIYIYIEIFMYIIYMCTYHKKNILMHRINKLYIYVYIIYTTLVMYFISWYWYCEAFVHFTRPDTSYIFFFNSIFSTHKRITPDLMYIRSLSSRLCLHISISLILGMVQRNGEGKCVPFHLRYVCNQRYIQLLPHPQKWHR